MSASFRRNPTWEGLMTKRVLLVVGLFLAFSGSAGAASPGAPGVGDRLYPLEGNGGYDVQHYDVDLTYGNKFTDPVDGTVNILARATQALSRFDLDFSGRSVGTVAVNGAPAAFRRDGQELIITPRKAIGDGARF